jgi:hypothetical protein
VEPSVQSDYVALLNKLIADAGNRCWSQGVTMLDVEDAVASYAAAGTQVVEQQVGTG